MPPGRRGTTAAALHFNKAERTHEENQERAYIAASRRSDRSLDARIESARRASELHKKRTGRALRITKQDVANEEMYEEEDDNLPAQYQRLSAHLQTSSWAFNRKLQDYIATQHGVRNMFLQQQFPGHTIQPSDLPMQPGNQMPFMNSSMLPPQTSNPTTQGFTQPSQLHMPQGHQQQQQQQPRQGYRHAPYNIPQRHQSYQRSASISTPQAVQNSGQPVSQADSTATTHGGETDRRTSLPPHAFEKVSQQGNDVSSRPPLSRSSTSQSVKQQPVSPQHVSAPTSGSGTPLLKSEDTGPTLYEIPTLPSSTSSQVLSMNPLTLSLPPESQQFIGSALDPNDPRTATLMAGSENLPQPFMSTYTYNPNLSPKCAQAGSAGNRSVTHTGFSASGMTQTLAPAVSVKLESAVNSATSNTPPSATLDNARTSRRLLTPTGFEYTGYFEHHQSTDRNRTANDGVSKELFEENLFINWDQ